MYLGEIQVFLALYLVPLLSSGEGVQQMEVLSNWQAALKRVCAAVRTKFLPIKHPVPVLVILLPGTMSSQVISPTAVQGYSIVYIFLEVPSFKLIMSYIFPLQASDLPSSELSYGLYYQSKSNFASRFWVSLVFSAVSAVFESDSSGLIGFLPSRFANGIAGTEFVRKRTFINFSINFYLILCMICFSSSDVFRSSNLLIQYLALKQFSCFQQMLAIFKQNSEDKGLNFQFFSLSETVDRNQESYQLFNSQASKEPEKFELLCIICDSFG